MFSHKIDEKQYYLTPLKLINLSLRILGVAAIGQTPLAEEINDAFTILNMMLAQWNRNRWLIYHLKDISTVSTGAQTYTVGPGANFNTPRTDQIESAYARLLPGTAGLSGGIDYPLEILDSYEDYALIRLKSLKSFPSSIFFDNGFPIGTIYLFPIPNATFEIHLIVKDTLTQFVDLVTEINLPPEYQEALTYNLAARLAPLYGLPPDQTIVTIAGMALGNIQTSNFHVPQMRMPPGLTRSGGGYQNHGIGGVREGVFTLDEDLLA